MNNNEQQSLIGKILGWVFGVMLCFGIFAIPDKSIRFMSITFTLLGVSLLPPVNMYLRGKFRESVNKNYSEKNDIKTVNRLYTIIKFIIVFFAICISTGIDSSEPANTTNNAKFDPSKYDKMIVIAPVAVKCKSENSSDCIDLNYCDAVYVVKNSLKNDFYKLSDGYVIHKEFVAFEGDERYNKAKAEDAEYQKQKAELHNEELKEAEKLIKNLQSPNVGLIKSIKENQNEKGYWDIVIDETVWAYMPYQNKQNFVRACKIYASGHSSNKFQGCIGYGYYDGSVYFSDDAILSKPMKMR